jgi:hypothetical protein
LQGQLAQPERLDQLVPPDLLEQIQLSQDQRETLEQRDLWDQLVQLVPPVTLPQFQAQLAQLEIKDLWDLRVLKEFRENLELVSVTMALTVK